MAPILKVAEALVVATTGATPVAPQAKSPNETPTRPQPVALEIPVTVNGARTVEGSDKREPFSETTHTVLVFPHGAVIRIATPLVPGQLVFVTNEKSKKEIVCQVVKSKSGGTTSGYVELQFTEPAAGFWGLLLPGASATPAAFRPATPASPAIPKPAPPASPVAEKPAAQKPVAPVPPFMAPVPPAVVPPPPSPLAKPDPLLQSPVATNPAVQTSVAPLAPPPPSVIPQTLPAQFKEFVEAAPKPPEFQAIKVVPPQAAEPLQAAAPPVKAASPTIPSPVLHDYSKEISALFAVSQTPDSSPAPPAAPAPNAPVSSSAPSTDELKLHAARLQEQLSSLLFTETAKASPAPPAPASPVISNPTPPVTEAAKKPLEIAFEEPKPVIKSEPKPAPPARIPMRTPRAEDEEVKIPSWLAPMSLNSEPLTAEPAAVSTAVTDSAPGVSVNSEESYDALVGDQQRQSQAHAFDGQLLDNSSAQAEEGASTNSKKGFYLGLAAGALLFLGGGAWYFRQNLFPSTPAPHLLPASVPSPQAPPAAKSAADLPAVSVVSAPAASTLNPAPSNPSPASPQAPKSSPPAPTKAVFNAAPEPKDFNPAPRSITPVEAPKKAAVGNVHLAAPVVNRSSVTQPGDALPAIDTNVASVGADPLAAVGSAHHKQPVAPLPVGGDVKPARLIKSVPPVYPQLARNQRVSGDVQIDAFIDTAGNVAELKIISGPTILHRAALDAVKQWKYSPAQLNGQATSMHLTVTVQFRTQ